MSEIPESSVTYEELADLERDFDDVEAEMSAHRPWPPNLSVTTANEPRAEQSASR